MEKPVKIMISFIAVVLYCMAAIGFSVGINHSSEADPNVETISSRIFVAEELPCFAGFALKEGANYFSAGNANQISLKQHQVQKAVIHALEVQITSAFSQYTSQLHINPVRIRKSDMLFPFHYFFESTSA